MPRLTLVFWLFIRILGTLIWVMSFLIVGETFDLGDDSFIFHDGISVSTCCRRLMVTTTSSAILASKTFLILVFLARLALVGKRLSIFTPRCVSRGSISGLSLFGVFLLLLHGPLSLRVSWVYFTDARRWLEYRFYLYIDGFLNSLFPGVQFPASGIQLGPDRKSQAFSKVLNHNHLIRSCCGVRLLENRL